MGTRVEVKFLNDYVASRGAAISGAKGQTKIFAKSDDLDALIKAEVVEKVRVIKPTKKKVSGKASKASRRSTATKAPAETS